ncbi:hypothetical protein PCYB_124020, partial [Plasmodium cynomolgi strain B]
NKKERVVLSFLLRAGGCTQWGSDADDQKGDDDKATHLLDVYMYLYLRRELKHSEGDENYRVLYFLNDRERFLNLGQYQFDMDHFAIRNWQHHMSLFRLNSMQNDQMSILCSKICIKGKLPNILMTTQGDYELVDSEEEKDWLLHCETAYRRTNARRYYIEWERDHHSGGTLHSVDTHDGNLSWSGKFMGSNKLPLTEYVIDVPKQHKLLSSPFTFLKKKLVYLCQEGEWFKGKYTRGVDTKNSYYVIKMGRNGLKEQTVQSCLAHLPYQLSADLGPCWICILSQDFHIRDVFDVICVNFCTPGVGR